MTYDITLRAPPGAQYNISFGAGPAQTVPVSTNRLPHRGGWVNAEAAQDQMPVSTNRLPHRGGWVEIENAQDQMPVSTNRLPHRGGWVDAQDAPIVYNPTPIGGCEPATGTTVVFFLKQTISIGLIDPTTLDVTFRFIGAGTTVIAHLNGVDQNSYTSSVVDQSTALESIYRAEITPPAGLWPTSESIEVSVSIEDDQPVEGTLVWTWCTEGVPQQTLSPAGIPSTLAHGTPNLVGPINPLGIASTLQHGTPTITLLIPTQVLLPLGIPSTLQHGTPTLIPFLQCLFPAGIPSTLRCGQPSFIISPVLGCVAPETDTIRGGKTVVMFAKPERQFTDTRYDEPMTSAVALPASFQAGHLGTGFATPSRAGLVLGSQQQGNSRGLIQTRNGFLVGDFDVAVDVQVLSPPQSRRGTIDAGVLEYEPVSGAKIQVGLALGDGFDAGAVTARSFYQQGGVTTNGGAVPVNFPGVRPSGTRSVPFPRVTLRLVRYGTHIWAFIGQRNASGIYTSLTKLLDWDRWSTATPGVVRLYVDNLKTRENVRVRFSNYTVRSHAIIGSRLLDNKVDLPRNRIAGDVPAVPIEELGAADITVFGLFGAAIGVDAFEYLLPDPKTLSVSRAIDTKTYQDVQLRDDEE